MKSRKLIVFQTPTPAGCELIITNINYEKNEDKEYFLKIGDFLKKSFCVVYSFATMPKNIINEIMKENYQMLVDNNIICRD